MAVEARPFRRRTPKPDFSDSTVKNPSMFTIPPLGLYVHIPWCVRKCSYCDFNSHASPNSLPESAYVAALLADLEQDMPLIPDREVKTIFIGGGTPSLFGPDSIAALLSGIANRVSIARDAEITLEANPGTVEENRFRGFRQAGVNRLSIGVQSFNDAHLCRIGRIHDSQSAIRAAKTAKKAGFGNFNLDLMFGLPDQTTDDALSDVETAIGLSPTHLSFYQLTLEPNTWFHKYPPKLPEDEVIWQAQTSCQTLLSRFGYRQYEVSAYALGEHRCRHNVNYWQFGDYLGIGAGAHGKLTNTRAGTIIRRWKQRHPQRYMETAGTPGCLGGSDPIEKADLPLEFLMNHLRLREGFRLPTFSARTGLPSSALEPGVTECIEAGLLDHIDDRILCTDKGWNFLDNVLEHFMADRQ